MRGQPQQGSHVSLLLGKLVRLGLKVARLRGLAHLDTNVREQEEHCVAHVVLGLHIKGKDRTEATQNK